MITRLQTRDKLGTFDKEKVIKPYGNSVIMDVKSAPTPYNTIVRKRLNNAVEESEKIMIAAAERLLQITEEKKPS